jgi:SNF family Na+-dependent transporter
VAERADKTGWVLALAAAALGAGTLARYPLGDAEDGLAFGILYLLGVVLLALPLLLGEAALGQFRRRNVVDTFGPGPWRIAGFALAIGALALAAYLAVVAGWAARYAYASFRGGFFDDPERYFRLASQGWDALLFAFAALAVAVAAAWSGIGRGLRGALVATGGTALVALSCFVAWALFAAGGDGRDAAFALGLSSIDAPLVVTALQQALLPGLVGFGVVAMMSTQVHDRTLPREAVLLGYTWVLAPVLVGAALTALAHDEGLSLPGGILAHFGSIAGLFGAIGGTEGGILAGTFYGVLLAGCLAAMVALLQVPATFLVQRSESWTQRRALAASGLVAYLAAIPLAFVAAAADHLEFVLFALVAPLAGIAISLHVGWARPEVLDGFVVGDAKHRLEELLRPMLRFVVPALLLALLVLGVLQALTVWGAMEHGSGGLWRLVP